MGGGASRGRQLPEAAPAGSRPVSSLSSRVQRVFASKFGTSAAGSGSDSDDDERERQNARKSRRAASKKVHSIRPPSGRSEASNADEKQLEKSMVLSHVQEKEMDRSKQALALLQSKPIPRGSKTQEAKSVFLKALDKRSRVEAEKQVAYSAKAAGDSVAGAEADEAVQGIDVSRRQFSDQGNADGEARDREASSASSPSQSSRRSAEDDAAAAAREAEEAEWKLKEEAAARQAEIEAAERAAVASAEQHAAAIAAAEDAYDEAEAAVAQNDLVGAREHHARGVEALTAVGSIKCKEYAMLEQILQRITDTAKAWLDALVDAEAAVSQSDKCFTARDLQGARAALDRAQELYSHANPEQAAASMHTRFEPARSLLEPAEEAELAELAEADALLAEAEDKLASLGPSCGKEGHIRVAEAACARALVCVDGVLTVLERPGVGSGNAPGARRRRCHDLKEVRIVGAKTAAEEGEARRLLTIEENFCSGLYTQAFLLQNEGKLADAEDYYRQALDAAKTRLPADHHAHPMYQTAFDAVLELQGKGPKFEEACRLAAQKAAEAEAALAAAAEEAEAERRRIEAEATAWKRDPAKRQEMMDAAVQKRKALLASRARDKLRRVVSKIKMIRLMGGIPADAVATASPVRSPLGRRRQTSLVNEGKQQEGADGGAEEKQQEEMRKAEESRAREEAKMLWAAEHARMSAAASVDGLPVAAHLSEEELARRVQAAKVRQMMLETGGQRGEFDAKAAFQRAGSGARMVQRLQRATGNADRDKDFLGGKELLMPFELEGELRDCVNQLQGFEGQAVEASSRHAAKSDEVNCLRMQLLTEGPDYEDSLNAEIAGLRAREEQRLAFIDRALGLVDLSQGAHMVDRQKSLEKERQEVVEECRRKIESVERDVKEWQHMMETRISTVDEEVIAEYDAVERFSRLADASRREVDLLKRAKRAAEERETVADMTVEAQQQLVDAELRKHALHCAAADAFQKDRHRLQDLQLAAEKDDADKRRRMQTRAHGSETRVQLDKMLVETEAAHGGMLAGGAWNCAALPGPKRIVRPQIERQEDGTDEASKALDEDDNEEAVLTVFRNCEGAERGVDTMEESVLSRDAELKLTIDIEGQESGRFVPSSRIAEDAEVMDLNPVSPEDARKIVQAERERWRTMLLRTEPRKLYDVGSDQAGDESPQAAPATPTQGTPMASNERSFLASTHLSLLSSWSQRSMTEGAGVHGMSKQGQLGSTIHKETDTVSSPDGRCQPVWVRDVFQASTRDGLRHGGLALLAQSREELQAVATMRLVEARRAMGAMRRLARRVRKAGDRLLDCAKTQLEQGAADVNSLSGAHRDAGRAASLLGLSASVRLDGWYRAREAEKAAQAVLQRADKLLCDMVGPQAAAMVGVGGGYGDVALLPSAVADAQTKLNLQQKAGHGCFTSFLGIPSDVATLVREMLREQAGRAEAGAEVFSDERLLADQRLESTGFRISQAQLESMRVEWHAELRLEDAIRRLLSGNLSRAEYDARVEAEGLQGLPTSEADTEIKLPADKNDSQALAPALTQGSGSWAYICGRWHFLPLRPAAGLVWSPSHFLQLAEADFEDMRRSSLYSLVSVPRYVDGFGRNKKQHWSILAEDDERQREVIDLQARTPANLPASHIGCLPAGSRPNWQSATDTPWKASATVNGSGNVRVGCDAPQVAYDASADALKAIDKLPHGDHLRVNDKPRAPWNSASFALGTAGSKAHWAGPEVMRGRGNERSEAVEDDVRRSVVYAIGEAFNLLHNRSHSSGQLQGEKDSIEETRQGGLAIQLDLSSMGLDDEYCFLITHALGHHPSGPVLDDGAATEGQEAGDDVPERLLPCPLQDEALHVSELRLAHNAIGDCGALDLALALGDVPWRLLAAPSRAEGGNGLEVDEGSSGTIGNMGMLRNVRKLDLRGNVIGNTGATALSDMLSVNSSLVEVSLADNHVNADGVEAVSRALATNVHLGTLNLSNNLIADEGIAPLSAILSWNDALLRQLPDAGAHSAVNLTLRVLILSGNSLGDAGAECMSAAIASHPSLADIGLDDNDIGDKGAGALRHALRLRRTSNLAPIVRLSLAHNSVTEAGIREQAMPSAPAASASSEQLVLNVLELSGNAGLEGASEAFTITLQAAGIGRIVW